MSFCVVPFVRRLCTAHFSLPFKMPHVKSIFRYFSFFFVRWTVELDCWLDGNRCLHFAYFCGPFYNEITCSVTCYSCYHSLLLLVPPKWKWALPTENSLFLQHFLMVFFFIVVAVRRRAQCCFCYGVRVREQWKTCVRCSCIWAKNNCSVKCE